MNEATLKKLCEELKTVLPEQKFGRIFLLPGFVFAIDFRLAGSRYLLISINPSAPRIHLIERSLGELEKKSGNETPFALLLRTKLAGAQVRKIEKLPDERIIRFDLRARDEIGRNKTYFLVAQLTGRSSNLYLLDENKIILDSARQNEGPGQEPGDRYAPPPRPPVGDPGKTAGANREIFPHTDFESLSAALDAHYTRKEAEQSFLSRVRTARSSLGKEISKRRRLLKNLRKDLENHGDPEHWKRSGDLLLANLATARREGSEVFVTDFYDDRAPTIGIPVDENDTLAEAAEKFFKRYTKARNAKKEIARRLEAVTAELDRLKIKKEELEKAVAEKNEEYIAGLAPVKERQKPAEKKRGGEEFSGARRFTSSDGYRILVGRRSKDNDHLTFRVARAADLWLHAADYPGSHVIVRNPQRKEIPPRTLLEAARLAAFYSKAADQKKVAVHYTQKKFVNKPKGAAPGLVSLASFKTILVEPERAAKPE